MTDDEFSDDIIAFHLEDLQARLTRVEAQRDIALIERDTAIAERDELIEELGSVMRGAC